VHADLETAMSEIATKKRLKTGGRQLGTPNRVTKEIREALRDLAEGNSDRVQGWLDRVAEGDPAEALRLWLALCRYVTPTLQAAAIEEISRPRTKQQILSSMTNDELNARIVGDPEVLALIERNSRRELSYTLESSPVRALIGVDDPLLR